MKIEITKDHGVKANPTCQDMVVGQLAECLSGSYSGHVLLRTRNGIVSLTDPSQTWTNTIPCMKVCILPVGAEVTLTQEGV